MALGTQLSRDFMAHMYILVVRASKGACHGIGHFIAAHTCEFNSASDITSLGRRQLGMRREVRFSGTTYDMSLQIRTKGNYATLGNNTDRPPLYYSVSRLDLLYLRKIG